MLTYEEIKDQYAALEKTLAYIEGRASELEAFMSSESKARPILFIGCGSSYCVAQSLARAATVKTGRPAYAMAAGDILLHHKSYDGLIRGAIPFIVSRSGSTTEILKALECLRVYGASPALSITCASGTPLEALSGMTLILPWAMDQSVCQTRTVTNLYGAALKVLALWAGAEELSGELYLAAKEGAAYLARYEESLKEAAALPWSRAVVLADGQLEGLAREAALAFREIARVPGDAFNVMDVRHGPMVLIGPETLVIACLEEKEEIYGKKLVEDLVKKGATVILYTTEKTEGLSVLMNVNAPEGCHDQAVHGLPFLLLSQLVSYYKAVYKGVDPDRPEGLEPWICL